MPFIRGMTKKSSHPWWIAETAQESWQKLSARKSQPSVKPGCLGQRNSICVENFYIRMVPILTATDGGQSTNLWVNLADADYIGDVAHK